MMSRKPAFWILLGLVSLGGATFSFLYFPAAFPLVTLDIRMDRQMALDRAGELAGRFGWGPENYRRAASFQVDRDVQNFVELEGGGKEAFAELIRGDLYSPYTWQVRHFREGETNETLIRFTPAGEPYGFRETIPEDRPGAGLEPEEAQDIARRAAQEDWGIDLSVYELVEQAQEVRPSGRVDHTLVFERPQRRLGEGRYRLRLEVSGDRFTELTHFVQVPEAFSRRFAEMRSANDAIAVSASVAMVILYIFIGCFVGLFFLLRRRWVIWRRAVFWGFLVSFLQVLVGLNHWPLLWMNYDTALSTQNFVLQQLSQLLAQFVFMGGLLSVSFVAAESLGRRAFPHHAQLWRIWSRPAASSIPVLGQTAAGYLLVSVFTCYAVLFYFFSSRVLGWWTPSETLFHPDVLATYFPWYSSIAISLQAGFWEECLFRAVPLAGAALLGKRFGHARLWIAGAFVIQALIFAGAHANYPNQPAYARLVELILPSFLFGALYLALGLLPAIILHFAYDVVWFALPLFASTAPGVWLDQLLVVVLALVPLGIVLSARLRHGRWEETVPLEFLNGAWTPPPPPLSEPEPAAPLERPELRRSRVLVLQAAGLAGLLVWIAAGSFRNEAPPLEIGRAEALAAARQALEERGVRVEPPWKMLESVEAARGTPHRFVWQEGGPQAYRGLQGQYLPQPRWTVRVARFEGDVAARAEEHRAFLDGTGRVTRISHRWPEDRPGARLSEDEARAIAHETIRSHFQRDPHSLRVVSVTPVKRPARDDWTFTFADPERYTLAEGEARLSVVIAGDQVVDTPRFIHVPEEWERRERNRAQLAQVLNLISVLFLVLLLGVGVVAAILSWTRKAFSVRVFLTFLLLLLGANVAARINGWPSVAAQFPTAQPWNIQVLITIAGLAVIVLFISLVLSLVNGLTRHWWTSGSRPGGAGSMAVGLPLGLVAGGLFAAGRLLEPSILPPWAGYGAAGSYVPFLGVTLGTWLGFVTQTTLLLLLIGAVDRLSRGWTRRRVLFWALAPVLGLALAGAGSIESIPSWIASGVPTGVFLLAAYIWVIRYDLAVIPAAAAATVVLEQLRQVYFQAFPGALAGGVVGILAVLLFALYWSRLLGGPGERPATEPAAPAADATAPEPREAGDAHNLN